MNRSLKKLAVFFLGGGHIVESLTCSDSLEELNRTIEVRNVNASPKNCNLLPRDASSSNIYACYDRVGITTFFSEVPQFGSLISLVKTDFWEKKKNCYTG